MINIRFHIVSITAVFLALAIGIFMGSSLLDRATVESLTSTQQSLEQRIAERGRENDALRALATASDESATTFADGQMRRLLNGTVADQVLLVAARGVSADAVGTVQADLAAIGAASAGMVWWEERADLAADDVRRSVAEVVGLDPERADAEAVADAVRVELARALGAVGAERPAEPNAPPDPNTPIDPATTTTTVPTAESEAAALLERLTSAGMLTWSIAGSGQPQPVLAGEPVRIVVISGEGASDAQHAALAALTTALSDRLPGRIVAAEVMDPRPAVEQVDRDLAATEPLRGAFVEPLREQDADATELATIDALDEPFGRFALLRLLALPPAEATGAYGVMPSASSPFPTS